MSPFLFRDDMKDCEVKFRNILAFLKDKVSSSNITSTLK